MAIGQLQWHLLKETTDILVGKLKCDSTPLFHLLMSGKAPAEAVRTILSQPVKLTKTFGNGYNMCYPKYVFIKPVYFKKLALLWTQDMELYDDDRNKGATFPDYVQVLRDSNCIEKLHFKKFMKSLKEAIAIIDACPNLSVLVGKQALFALLLRNADVNIINLRSIELRHFKIDEEDGYDRDVAEGRFIFEALAKHPERCPLLESITITADKWFGIYQCLNGIVLPAIKSLTIVIDEKRCWDAVDFTRVSSVCESFLNVENVSFTCTRMHLPTRTMESLERFNNFDGKFKLNFNYNLEYYAILDSTIKSKDDFQKKFETELSGYGSASLVIKKERKWEYLVSKSLPNKTMTMRVNIRFSLARSYYDNDSDERSTWSTSDDDDGDDFF